ncbi:MAG: hypothetical protein R3C56_32620 [Pirellulaceae bacterium]
MLDARCYETRRVDQLSPDVATARRSGPHPNRHLSSGLVAEASCELLALYREQLQPISISSAVSQRLSDPGWPAVTGRREFTRAACAAAICRAGV